MLLLSVIHVLFIILYTAEIDNVEVLCGLEISTVLHPPASGLAMMRHIAEIEGL